MMSRKLSKISYFLFPWSFRWSSFLISQKISSKLMRPSVTLSPSESQNTTSSFSSAWNSPSFTSLSTFLISLPSSSSLLASASRFPSMWRCISRLSRAFSFSYIESSSCSCRTSTSYCSLSVFNEAAVCSRLRRSICSFWISCALLIRTPLE